MEETIFTKIKSDIEEARNQLKSIHKEIDKKLEAFEQTIEQNEKSLTTSLSRIIGGFAAININTSGTLNIANKDAVVEMEDSPIKEENKMAIKWKAILPDILKNRPKSYNKIVSEVISYYNLPKTKKERKRVYNNLYMASSKLRKEGVVANILVNGLICLKLTEEKGEQNETAGK